MGERPAANLSGKDRLIVALDVPTHEEALTLVEKLENVSFFKVGLELFLAGNLLGFINELQGRRSGEGGVFVDLKLSGDIGNTIASFIEGCTALNVRFVTLTESMPYVMTTRTIETALKTRGVAEHPKILMVPLLSSLSDDDLRSEGITGTDSAQYILERGEKLLAEGCDGLIVSGDAIGACRERFPNADIVSPGIRPAWSASDDHKRITTPADAIRMGSDYLVVGRPITKNDDPFSAAKAIIDEMDEAIDAKDSVGAAG
ncbi:MAG: orotidine-5'-phosphate decarboxylase [Nitrospinae bacterium]|nr:orotidine-5'-phosphate decarboxylase [Nitrospinota bacterium]